MDVNAIIAIPVSDVLAFKNILRDARQALESGGVLTTSQEKAMKIARVARDGEFLEVTVGPRQFRLFNVVCASGALAALAEIVPNAVIAGCWNRDGSQFGQTLERVHLGGDEYGLAAVGTPTYPIHPRLLNFMPDDVEYNADGTEKSRKRPTALKQVHKYLGWADRRWT